MPQNTIARWAVAKVRATVRKLSASMPQTAAMASGGNCRRCSFSRSKPSVCAWMYWVS